jgi:plasmid maintenance system antidote protein VapI
MKNIHIGSVIRKKLKERDMCVIDFANAMHCSRSCVYSLFERRNIDLELLVSISKILNYDLSTLYLEEDNQSKEYILIIKTNELKKNELLLDDRIKIIEAWRMSERVEFISE